jgi:homoserine kinase type II
MSILLDRSYVARLRYEHALLLALSQKNLPFLLPELLPAFDGNVVVSFEYETDKVAFAAMYPFLAGKMSESGTCENAAQAGCALALLDQAFVNLPMMAAPVGHKELVAFGNLAVRHPLVPDPLVAVENLPIDREQVRHLSAILARVSARVEDLYARLPQQLVHRDLDVSNLLFDAWGVTSVIDFEFATVDLRVLDLCVTLSWWPVSRMGTGTEWEIIDAVGSAYMAGLPLDDDELLAIPDVMQLRDAASLIHRIGRYLAGQESASQIQRRVEHSLWRDTWLSAQREVLLEHALSWRDAAKGRVFTTRTLSA